MAPLTARAALLPAAALAALAGPAAASAAGIQLTRIATVREPVHVAQPPADPHRLYVSERKGRVRLIRDGQLLARPFLDLSRSVSTTGERGLFSIAFAPDFARSHLFYVSYGERPDNLVVREFRADATGERMLPRSGRVVLRQAHPVSNHNGGLVEFGPDGLLYVGWGDGGGSHDRHGPRGNAQNLGSLLGKILRIDPRRHGRAAYAIPRDNPFVGRRGARGEIYSYGLRNPWRFSFDRATGDMIIGDVGQDEAEEVDFALRGRARGANYGWRVFEGRRRETRERAPGAVAPVLTYPHSAGRCAITGGYVVRDPALGALAGWYVYGDFCTGQLYGALLGPGAASGDHALGLRATSLTSFGEDGAGHVYATSFQGGVFRLDPA
ncbi:MAG TPA: PQQ-dependent sugar dehydrogenase [Solirubrobacteraceae bacterium]|nr:PQQ-dependent sugar dehydrogenase [Solirubrobacteraceae bacterium]